MSTKRSVITDEHVHDAFRKGRQFIEVLPNTIVTAQARETAQRLKIALRDGPLEQPLVVKTDGSTAMRRVLFRRHPAFEPPRRQSQRGAAKIPHLALVGAGGVGMNIAHLAANCEMADNISIIDVLPGAAEAVALDLQHSSGVSRSSTHLVGGTGLGLVADADVVVVTAGRPRTPGMTRADLLTINGRVINSVGEQIANLAPNAIVIVVSNPLDEMTFKMLQVTGFPRERVLGMAGTLDSSRFRFALAKAAGVSVNAVEAITLGSHGEEMVPVASKATIKDRSLDVFLSSQQIEQCRMETIGGGAAVVGLKKTGSATLAPAQATVELLDHIRGARAGSVPVSVLLKGEYGIHDTVVGVPCKLGRSGVVEIVELSLAEKEIAELKAAAKAVKSRLESS
ncbi:MAG: malate dehydrogenase [Parasphingorhabdus sp.]|jgi:malate dehydrogenase